MIKSQWHCQGLGKKNLKRNVVWSLGTHTHKEKKRRMKVGKPENGCRDKGNNYFGRRKPVNAVFSVPCDTEYIQVDFYAVNGYFRPLLMFTETLNTFPLQYFFVGAPKTPENMGEFFLVGYWAFFGYVLSFTFTLKCHFYNMMAILENYSLDSVSPVWFSNGKTNSICPEFFK